MWEGHPLGVCLSVCVWTNCCLTFTGTSSSVPESAPHESSCFSPAAGKTAEKQTGSSDRPVFTCASRLEWLTLIMIVGLWTLVLCEEPGQSLSDVLFAFAAGREQQQGGTRRMDVHLPSVRAEEEEEVMESLSAAADTDSSTTDVF